MPRLPAEWLEVDGLGGYATGRADGIRTRRYHALLVAATRPPTGRVALVHGFDAWVEIGDARVAVSAQRYVPGVTHPDGASRIAAFGTEPWPEWRYEIAPGVTLVHAVTMRHGAPVVALSWQPTAPLVGARLVVRPFLSGRDVHGEHHENATFAFDATVDDDGVTWRPYPEVPRIVARSNGVYTHEPLWYRGFQYDEERARGLPFVEDLASPGTFAFDLAAGPAWLSFGADMAPDSWHEVAAAERVRRDRFPSPMHRAADAYVVTRGAGLTIVAGYPWFSDWGRDTFIALRGLLLATGRAGDARAVLVEWARHVSEGMLPNYFPDGVAAPAYNSADASLWFCVAAHETMAAAGPDDRLSDAIEAIVAGYARGTRFGIRADGTGLLCAGEPGVQLTWMDARVDGREVTPRTGKPVELQALWINALHAAGVRSPRWVALAEHARASFAELFWNDEAGRLFDVVDVDHVRGTHDAALRPNQILAVGGLPWALLDGERARRVVDVVERALWTPAGLRSLAPGEPGYVGRYAGDARARDGAYHQGTVWPWLAGPFVDAWVQVRGGGDDVRRMAHARFVAPLLAHWAPDAPGHVGEVADGDAPHAPGGCPFQAWSVGEVLRLATALRGLGGLGGAPVGMPRPSGEVRRWVENWVSQG